MTDRLQTEKLVPQPQAVQALLSMTVGLALLVAPSIARHHPLLIWNASPSVPVGLYLVTQVSPRTGDLIVLQLPPVVAGIAARRGYLPQSAYLLKPIAATAGDLICRFGVGIFLRSELVAAAQIADSGGNPMPAWHGCRVLQAGEVFVLADHPASFDSRYFGPLEAASIVGRAIPLWANRSA